MIDINNIKVNRWYEYYADRISYLDILYAIKIMWVLDGELILSASPSWIWKKYQNSTWLFQIKLVTLSHQSYNMIHYIYTVLNCYSQNYVVKNGSYSYSCSFVVLGLNVTHTFGMSIFLSKANCLSPPSPCMTTSLIIPNLWSVFLKCFSCTL